MAHTSPEPNFFLVGAARSGTTSLWQALRRHPEIFMPGTMLTKEPSHFCEPTPPWAAKYQSRDAYLALFASARTQKAIGEASAAYLGAPGCAKRIHAAYPQARIIIILRQPARRTFSIYRYMCMLGLEWLPTFERALEAEKMRDADEGFKRKHPFWYDAYQYTRSSEYAPQLRQYLDQFPSNQIHVLLLDDLKRRPAEAMQAVLRFLDVDPAYTPPVQEEYQSLAPLSAGLQHFLARQWRLNPMQPAREPRFIDHKLLPILMGCNLLLGKVRTVNLRPDTERHLMERFRSDVALTSQMIGRDLSSWLPGPR